MRRARIRERREREERIDRRGEGRGEIIGGYDYE